MEKTYSVESELYSYADDEFNGSLEECVEYTQDIALDEIEVDEHGNHSMRIVELEFNDEGFSEVVDVLTLAQARDIIEQQISDENDDAELLVGYGDPLDDFGIVITETETRWQIADDQTFNSYSKMIQRCKFKDALKQCIEVETEWLNDDIDSFESDGDCDTEPEKIENRRDYIEEIENLLYSLD